MAYFQSETRFYEKSSQQTQRALHEDRPETERIHKNIRCCAAAGQFRPTMQKKFTTYTRQNELRFASSDRNILY